MASNQNYKEITLDLRKEAGGTLYVKNKDGVHEEGDWSVLDGMTVGELS